MSQTKEILGALKKGQHITAIDALREFNCFRCAARVNDIKNMGYDVHTEIVKENGKRFASYSMGAV